MADHMKSSNGATVQEHYAKIRRDDTRCRLRQCWFPCHLNFAPKVSRWWERGIVLIFKYTVLLATFDLTCGCGFFAVRITTFASSGHTIPFRRQYCRHLKASDEVVLLYEQNTSDCVPCANMSNYTELNVHSSAGNATAPLPALT